MRLYEMHDAFKTSLEGNLKERMTQDQLVFHLVLSEWDNRRNQALERADLLILDDFRMQPLDAQGRGIIMDIIEDRHGRRSTMITSQVVVKEWHIAIGEKTVADAMLDRIVHHALRIELFGESIRKRK